ncbi:MAG: xanthine dehydrogenase family protein molybdopterin-binding subunit [Betaproteobacteria bacterium]|nr:MAG: xanthine dehydrogenase family protein molybdopterin-binding subunit [Betaproteobacteria bacterium]
MGARHAHALGSRLRGRARRARQRARSELRRARHRHQGDHRRDAAGGEARPLSEGGVPRRRPQELPLVIGQPVRRKEDDRLLRGAGCYADDWNLPGQVYACMVRSPHAHATILSISSAPAAKIPGVLAVLTGTDAAADGLKPLPHKPVTVNPHEVVLKNRDGSAFKIPPYVVLPTDKARFVGEAVAMVIAETAMAARDGADAVVIDFEPLPSATKTVDATAPDAPMVWSDIGSNICVDANVGDAPAVDAAFRRAAHVVRLETTLNRVTGVPLELRAALGVYENGRYTVYTPSGGVQRFRTDVAGALGVPEDAVRVVARDVGGSYGVRNYICPEHVLVAWAARRLGRPVKWRAERSECFLTDDHSRDLRAQAELALDAEGNFLAFRSTNTSNVGAHARGRPARARGAQQHHADLALSRRRTSRGDVRHRAPDRPRCPAPWLRPRGAPPPQPDRILSVPEPARPGLRQRRLCGDAGARARTGAVVHVRRTAAPVTFARQAARHRHGQLHRAEYRPSARARRSRGPAGRPRRRRARHDLVGPGA